MSYILEALKKAQAERQLGSAPTIHAPSAVHAVPVSAGSRRPLLVGVAVGALLAVAAVIVAWRHQAPAPTVLASAQPATGADTATPAPQADVPVASTPPVIARPPVASPPVAPVPVARPSAAPVPAASMPAAPVASPNVSATRAATSSKPAVAVSAPSAARAARPAQVPVPSLAVPAPPVSAASTQAPTPVVEKPVAPAAEDNVGTLAQLPEAIQREVPHVAFGGYIYSPNPADRLLLVDKALRHEGEEVAPGLVLEKLLPKAAVMNFRGYRYRVAY